MMPVVVNNLELWHGVVALLIIILGYPIHELLHIIPLEIAGRDYRIRLRWRRVLFGRFVEIQDQTDAPQPVVLASALAPAILWVPSIVVYGWLLCGCSGPVLLSDLLAVGAWFVIFLPSPVDWRQAWQAITQSDQYPQSTL